MLRRDPLSWSTAVAMLRNRRATTVAPNTKLARINVTKIVLVFHDSVILELFSSGQARIPALSTVTRSVANRLRRFIPNSSVVSVSNGQLYLNSRPVEGCVEV